MTTYIDSPVAEGTNFCYRLRTFKAKGNNPRDYSSFSGTDCAETGTSAPQPPNAPTNLVADAVSSSQIDLTWQDNSNNEDNFRIERCQGTVTSCGDADFAFLDDVGPNVTGYSDTGLPASTTFTYRVRAENAAGASGYSNEDDATTFVPPQPPDAAPTNLVATAASSSRIDLTWTDNATNEDGYEVWECVGTVAACDEVGLSNYSVIDSTGANSSVYSRTGLSASTTYSYLVRAFNPAGVSGFSNEDDATTLEPPAPGDCPDNGTHDDTSDPGLWGIVRIKADQNPHWLGVRGNGPECAMQAEFFGLDTGVDSDHPDLNVVETHAFVSDGSGGEDGNGHGSHTAGTAAAIDGGPAGGVVGVAPGARIHGFKVCSDGGSCPLDAIIAGVDTVTARKNASPGTDMVANMSLGGGISASIDQAVRGSVAAGVTYSLSAGNGVFGACFFPADAQNTSPARVGDDDITAGGGSNGDTRRVNGAVTTTSSGQTDADVNCNYGNPVTVAAPGVGIKSTWLNGGYNTIGGTSMAAPHAAGAAILYLQGFSGSSPTATEQAMVDDLDNWTTNDLPNADGRLDARCLGTDDTSCQGAG